MRKRQYLSTEDAARELGCVSRRWVRAQIEEGRLAALALTTGQRVTYRIPREAWEQFTARYVRHTQRDVW